MHLDFDLAKAQKKTWKTLYSIFNMHTHEFAIITKINDGDYQENNNLELNDKDRQLMLYGSRYYDALLEHAEKLEVHKVATYIYNLSKIFHSFYKDNKVIYDNQSSKT